jgi:hypothetical protein
MKHLLLIAFVFAGTLAFSQATEDEDLKLLWETNIQPIIDQNAEAIAERTQFPLGGEWYMAIDYEMMEEDATKEFFLENLDKVFTEEVRSVLREMDYNKLSVMGDENWTIVTLLIQLNTEVEGEIYESMMAFELEWVEDKWMLTSINMMG